MFIVLRHIICPIAHGFVYCNYFFPYVHIGSDSSTETKRVLFFPLSGATEVSWAFDKGCRILKKSPEAMLVAWKGVADGLHSFATELSTLSRILSSPMEPCPRKAGALCMFLQGCSWLWDSWRNLPHDVAMVASLWAV